MKYSIYIIHHTHGKQEEQQYTKDFNHTDKPVVVEHVKHMEHNINL